jgi:hypothetical protein
VLVGDRGMITQARIEEELKPAGLDWITALRAPLLRAAGRDLRGCCGPGGALVKAPRLNRAIVDEAPPPTRG